MRQIGERRKVDLKGQVKERVKGINYLGAILDSGGR
jgi:hypothetical protein